MRASQPKPKPKRANRTKLDSRIDASEIDKRFKDATELAKLALRGWVSVTELSRFLGVSRDAILDLIAMGELRAILIGTRWRIPLDEAKRFAQNGLLSQDRDAQLEMKGNPDD
jgi:excisionase family DNA binding protein